MKKNILIIGGSKGIGRELARILAPENQVYVASRTAEQKENNATYFTFDALNDDIAELDLPEEIHGFVYCPGSILLKPFANLKASDFIDDFQLNFVSMTEILRSILPKLKSAANASIILFSSVAVQKGMPFHTVVSASKGAIEGFARSLAAEYAPKIRVNVIAPSLTETPLAEKFISTERKLEKMTDRHPLERIGKPNDIAAMAAFLLNNESTWITGQVFGVDGGLSTIQLN